MSNEYTKRLEDMEKAVETICAGDNNGKVQDILTDLLAVLHEMSDDIESLRNRSHTHYHDGDTY